MRQLELSPLLDAALPPVDEMWAAFLARDASYEGVFWPCVKTTGIYCRPTCSARKPKRENVEFVRHVVDAERLGYRACKRCRPLEALGALPAWAEALASEVRDTPSLRLRDSDLRQRGHDPARVRRLFLSHFGVTFQAWQRAQRLGAAMQGLQDGASIGAVAFDAGFDSESGFRDAWTRYFGMNPSAARQADCLRVRRFTTPLGVMLAVASERGLVLCEFLDRRALESELATIRKRFSRAIVPGRSPVLDAVEAQLAEYFDGRRTQFELDLDLIATPFQSQVWSELQRIPYGQTQSYGELARAIGRPGAGRAVGRANGQNRIAILIPCHRVVGADGELRGYGGGLWRKQRLLEIEILATSRS